MEVKLELIIESLFDGELNQFQIGYNCALIQILKKCNVSKACDTPKESFELSLCDRFKNVMAKDGFSEDYEAITKKDLIEILSAVERKEKLTAVKSLKYATRMGLKEAKDVIDQLI